jgi:hypothetical protein
MGGIFNDMELGMKVFLGAIALLIIVYSVKDKGKGGKGNGGSGSGNSSSGSDGTV